MCTSTRRPARVSIQLDINLEMLRVTIEDNGIGFDMARVLRDPEKWDHFGIKGILERARLVGGEGQIDVEERAGHQDRRRSAPGQ